MIDPEIMADPVYTEISRHIARSKIERWDWESEIKEAYVRFYRQNREFHDKIKMLERYIDYAVIPDSGPLSFEEWSRQEGEEL